MPACFVIAACYLLGIALILLLNTEYMLVNTPLAHALGVVYINIFVRMNVTCRNICSRSNIRVSKCRYVVVIL